MYNISVIFYKDLIEFFKKKESNKNVKKNNFGKALVNDIHSFLLCNTLSCH